MARKASLSLIRASSEDYRQQGWEQAPPYCQFWKIRINMKGCSVLPPLPNVGEVFRHNLHFARRGTSRVEPGSEATSDLT